MIDLVTIDDYVLTALEENRGRVSVDTLFYLMQRKGVQDVDTRAAIWRLKGDGLILHRGSELELKHYGK